MYDEKYYSIIECQSTEFKWLFIDWLITNGFEEEEEEKKKKEKKTNENKKEKKDNENDKIIVEGVQSRLAFSITQYHKKKFFIFIYIYYRWYLKYITILFINKSIITQNNIFIKRTRPSIVWSMFDMR